MALQRLNKLFWFILSYLNVLFHSHLDCDMAIHSIGQTEKKTITKNLTKPLPCPMLIQFWVNIVVLESVQTMSM